MLSTRCMLRPGGVSCSAVINMALGVFFGWASLHKLFQLKIEFFHVEVGGVCVSWWSCDFRAVFRKSLSHTDKEIHLYTPSLSVRVSDIIMSPAQTCPRSPADEPAVLRHLDLTSNTNARNTPRISSPRIKVLLVKVDRPE